MQSMPLKPCYLAQPPRESIHDWLQRACVLLGEYQIESVPDQLALAVALCCSQGGVLSDARLHAVLAGYDAQRTPLDEALAPLLETPPTNLEQLPLQQGLS